MSKTPEELLLDWSRAGFANLDREQLKKAAEMLGVEYAPQTNTETLRNKLRDAIGTVDGTLPDETVSRVRDEMAPKPKLALQMSPPNLSPSGRWGGRYRRIRLVRTDFYKTFVAFPVGWEGVIKYFHFDTEVDMPWPYYESLRNMRETSIIKELSPDGRHSTTREVTNQVLPFSDMGDVPGTENLPRSMMEYVQWLAEAQGHFAKAERRDLIRVLRWLHGQGVNAQVKDVADEDLRDRILTFIGVDVYEQDAA